MPRAYDSDYRRPVGYDAGLRRDPFPGYGPDYGAQEPEGGGKGWRRLVRARRGRLVPRTDCRTRGDAGHGGARGWNPLARGREEMDGVDAVWRGQPQRGYPGTLSRGYERPEVYPGGARRAHGVPPDWRHYLSREEYGLGRDGAYDREFQGDRFRRGPLGARNALFGGEGFVRYDRDYDEQWW